MSEIISAFAVLLPYCFVICCVTSIWNMVITAFKGGY